MHNICIGAGDIMAPDADIVEDVAEDVLEAVSGAPWRDQLCAEVSALEEVPMDHQYIKAVDCVRPANPRNGQWREVALETSQEDAPPSEDTRVLSVAAHPGPVAPPGTPCSA
ncbi:hypothetical protein JOQ06_006175 [Pogonophryne albipinna]|uniref:Uncharacterized protein n=1 Tax=Pogonophryne albipinna TaxID=1090488 RepID=A0AAD6BHN3_9TELE|nr:hypothetical protein JOQ06_006175 [Pogonophryne albipinna]